MEECREQGWHASHIESMMRGMAVAIEVLDKRYQEQYKDRPDCQAMIQSVFFDLGVNMGGMQKTKEKLQALEEGECS